MSPVPENKTPEFSFVIPAYNEEKRIGGCIASISAEIEREGCAAEIIVVNNASTDGTAATALSYRNVRVEEEPLKGLTRARQKGLLSARGDFVAYLDADSRIGPGWIGVVRKDFISADVVSVSGAPRYYDLTGLKKCSAEMGWLLAAPPAYWIAGYMIWGGSFVVRKRALHAAGGFDTSIVFYGEDTDIAKRLRRVGKTVFHFRFPVTTSGRRLAKRGLLATYCIYGLNFVWEAVFQKPFTKGREEDVR